MLTRLSLRARCYIAQPEEATEIYEYLSNHPRVKDLKFEWCETKVWVFEWELN